MEIWHRISIDGKDADYWRGRGLKMKPIRSAFYPDGTAKNWVADISESDPCWLELKSNVEGGLNFINTFFTDEERLAAEWCILRGAGPLRPLEPEGGNWSSDYYQAICGACGSGWSQIAPFRVRTEPRMGRNAFASFWSAGYELFVRQEVLDTFQEEGVRGVDSWPVLIGKDRHLSEGVRELLVKTVAEPAIADELVEHEHYRPSDCLGCGRRWHLFYSRGMLPLRRSALRSDVDFQVTSEWFGSGRAARQEILVSRGVVQLILRKKWKGAELSPVQTV